MDTKYEYQIIDPDGIASMLKGQPAPLNHIRQGDIQLLADLGYDIVSADWQNGNIVSLLVRKAVPKTVRSFASE